MSAPWREVPRLGPWVEGDRCTVRVWAPERASVTLRVRADASDDAVAMEPEADGYFAASFTLPEAGADYALQVDGGAALACDPMSLAVGEWSRAERPRAFAWGDAGWRGLSREGLVLCELHVGTATEQGDFDALIGELAGIKALGVTAIELMPVASFSGARNWGYDGVFLLAPFAGYGGGDGLKRLVNAAHRAGLGVVLDVVYNHLGPHGLDLTAFTPRYFSRAHGTPWGSGFAFDEAPVRAMVLRSVERWIAEFHLDGLRLDATWCMHDDSAPTILAEIGAVARAAAGGRAVVLIAEDGRGLPSITEPVEQGGAGMDAQWSDDLHDALRQCFEAPTEGCAERLARTLDRGWRHAEAPARGRLVAYLQNHDQVGNRPENKRFGARFGAAAQRAASALVLLSPAIPMLFLGEWWSAPEPFHFFTDLPPALGCRVALGRAREHPGMGRVPSPQSRAAFRRSVLRAKHRETPGAWAMTAWYRWLLSLRAKHPCFQGEWCETATATHLGESVVVMLRPGPAGRCVAVIVCLAGALAAPMVALVPRGEWRPLAWSAERRFGGRKRAASEALTHAGVRVEGPCALVLEGALHVHAE